MSGTGKQPNIIWIFPDEWRHDAAGYAGNQVVQTPHLDALAARGSSFRQAYCESPVCQPSRASLLTCRYPVQHGKTQNGADPMDPQLRALMPAGTFPAPESDNILHRLQAAGYYTAEVGKMHFQWGEEQSAGYVAGGADAQLPAQAASAAQDGLRAFGFDEVAEEHDKHVLMLDSVQTPYTRYLDSRGLLARWRVHAREQNEIIFGRDPYGRAAMADLVDPADALDTFIGRQTCERIEHLAAGEQPFFLWAGFVGPHPPFDGPPPISDRYDPAQIPLGPTGFDGYPDNRYGEYMRFCMDFLGAAHYTEDDFRLMGKYYYAGISLIDVQIGRIVEAVERAGIAGNTWIFFSSDHGELLGDHGLITKAVFYDAAVRVPALVVPPRSAGPAPAQHAGLAQGIDVPATILEVAGADGAGLAGRSLLHSEGSFVGRSAIFSQIAAFTMITTPELKLVVETATLEPQVCYDLRLDPDERVDVCQDPSYAAAIGGLVADQLRRYVAGEIG